MADGYACPLRSRNIARGNITSRQRTPQDMRIELRGVFRHGERAEEERYESACAQATRLRNFRHALPLVDQAWLAWYLKAPFDPV